MLEPPDPLGFRHSQRSRQIRKLSLSFCRRRLRALTSMRWTRDSSASSRYTTPNSSAAWSSLSLVRPWRRSPPRALRHPPLRQLAQVAGPSPEYPSLQAPPEELNSILQERGLGYDQMTRAGVFNIASGVLSGVTSARIQGLKGAATTTTAKVATGIAEPIADVGIGLTESYLSNGNLTVEEALVQTVQSGLLGSAIGHAHNQPAANGTRTTSDAEPSPSSRHTRDTPTTAPSANRHGVVDHKNLESVRTSFVQDSIKQTQATQGRDPTVPEVRAIEEQASTMRAYQNSSTGEVHALRVDQSASRLQRVAAASDIVHELVHRKNGDEFAAHKAQIEFLQKNGYQVNLIEGAMKISPARPGGPRSPSDASIRDYIDTAYPSRHQAETLQRSAGVRTLDEIGTDIKRMIQELPDPQLVASLTQLVSKDNFSEALNLVSVREDAEFQKLREANFDLADKLGELKQALQSHPESFHSVRPPPVKVGEAHLTNSNKEIKDYLERFNYRLPLKAKVAQLLQDLSEVRSVEELQALSPQQDSEPTSVRSWYGNQQRFHRYEAPVGPREVWVLEVDAGDRIIIGFDRSTHRHTLLYTCSGHPHGQRTDYKPEVMAAMQRFLRR
jgi:hypothetical protein